MPDPGTEATPGLQPADHEAHSLPQPGGQQPGSGPAAGAAAEMSDAASANERFRKAAPIVHSRPSMRYTLLERKIANALLKHAINSQPEEGWYVIALPALKQAVGFSSRNFEHLRASAEALMKIVFEWDVLAIEDRRVRWKASVLFPEIEIRHGELRYQISSQMREQLLRPELYALIDLRIMRRFVRAPALAIWEYAMRFEALGNTKAMRWEDFRDMILGTAAAAQAQYAEYKRFKERVLRPAINEINSVTLHDIALREIKAGKRIESIYFVVARKAKMPATRTSSDEQQAAREATLVAEGVRPAVAKRLVREFGANAVDGALPLLRERRSKAPALRSAAAYLTALLRDGAAHATARAPRRTAEATPPRPSVREMYEQHRLSEAARHFGELDAQAQRELIARFNAAQPIAALRVGARLGKAAMTRLHAWLAKELWGEPTEGELLRFAESLLASGQAGQMMSAGAAG